MKEKRQCVICMTSFSTKVTSNHRTCSHQCSVIYLRASNLIRIITYNKSEHGKEVVKKWRQARKQKLLQSHTSFVTSDEVI